VITDVLKTTLANFVETSLTAQSYRWNVEGAASEKFGELFAEAHHSYNSQIDKIGEYIRTESNSTDYFTGSVDILGINKTVVFESLVGDNGDLMCNALIKMNEGVLENIDKVYALASEDKNFGLIRYCEDRIIDITKLNYKLSTINK
jgi:DNA-binding ferritin-like protein